MGMTAEWGQARDTVVVIAEQGDHPFESVEPVSEPVALAFDANSGGGMVIEGSARELVRILDTARAALGPALAAEALGEWEWYWQKHAELIKSDPCEADDFEDHQLLPVATKLAAAVAALLN